jgi:adenosylhomocysteine nucleosidase
VITGIVVALPEELKTLTSQRIEKGRSGFIGDNLLVARAGTGISNAQAAAEQLVEQGATRLVSWGCAGALDDRLKPGDLVLADKLIAQDRSELCINVNWHGHCVKHLTQDLPVITGYVIESAHIVSDSQEKHQLHTATGALAVDMESIAIAKVALSNALPFIAIRAIVDPANMDLPKAIAYAANDEGDIQLMRLLAFIARHPSELSGLVRLGFAFNAAQSTLKRIAKRINVITEFNTF